MRSHRFTLALIALALSISLALQPPAFAASCLVQSLDSQAEVSALTQQ